MATYDAQTGAELPPAVAPGLVSYTHAMYGLHALAIVMGLLTSATIVGSFVFSVPSIVAVIMNYVRRSETRGTWLESHFRWQLRTFWFVLLWTALSLLCFGWLVVLLVGIPLLFGAFVVIGLWAAYRILRGWIALSKARAVP